MSATDFDSFQQVPNLQKFFKEYYLFNALSTNSTNSEENRKSFEHLAKITELCISFLQISEHFREHAKVQQ